MFDERACYTNECVRRWFWGIHLLQRLRVPPGFPSFPRMPVVMLLQLGAATLCLRKRTPQSHLLYVGCCAYLIARFINEAVRRWLWGIYLLQRLRVPPGFPSFPRMPVVMLLQLGAATLCLRKRTPQSHLLWVGCCAYLESLATSQGQKSPKRTGARQSSGRQQSRIVCFNGVTMSLGRCLCL